MKRPIKITMTFTSYAYVETGKEDNKLRAFEEAVIQDALSNRPGDVFDLTWSDLKDELGDDTQELALLGSGDMYLDYDVEAFESDHEEET